MSRLRENFLSGLVSDNPLTAGALTLNSANLALLPVVTSPDTMTLILDPYGTGNGPEIVWVTAHTASATSATIVRGQEDTTGVEHAQYTPWIHGPTAVDWAESETHDHASLYAPLAHVDSRDGHPVATAALDGLMDSADKAKLDGIEAGATADMTAADIRAAGFFDVTNDGAGSGLDADKLDGQHGSYFADAATLGGHKGGYTTADHPEATVSARGFMSAADKTKLNGIEASATADQTGSEILAALLPVDGPGTELDADTLDGTHLAALKTIASYASDRNWDSGGLADLDLVSVGYTSTSLKYVAVSKGFWVQQFGLVTGWVLIQRNSSTGSGAYLVVLPTQVSSYLARGSSVEEAQAIGGGFVKCYETGAVHMVSLIPMTTDPGWARIVLESGEIMTQTNPWTAGPLDVFNLWFMYPHA